VLLETGETLVQIQNRVLGTASSSSLYDAVPGGHELTVDVESIGGRNLPRITWGAVGPVQTVVYRRRSYRLLFREQSS